ncbi:MFS transporter [Parvimonas micra]|uniref:MFS transporter n=1 Tax=Parvimonas micra TaxID=33033 RepID=UPI002B46BBF0|nr:MFS transporter [Parvimonas micra]MEB3060701.1 MFS transporter [Parvimonas micra]MEB3066726.1 MFS transporter [Parvimonas micra]
MFQHKKDFKNAILLLSGNIVTTFGNVLLSNALNLWIIQISGKTKTLGIIASIGLIPTLIFTIFGGIISDSFNKKRVVFICDLISGVLCCIMSILVDDNHLNIYYIVIFRFLLSLISAIFKPAMMSLPAYSISEYNRMKFNSYFNISNQIFQIITPIISGVLIGIGFSIKIVLFFDGITFLLSSLSEIFIDCSKDEKSFTKNKWSTSEKFLSAFRYIFSNKYLTCIILFASLINIFIAGYNMFLPYYGSYVGKKYYGYLLAIEALGGIIGAFSLQIDKFHFDNGNMEFNLFISGVFLNLFFIFNNLCIMYIIVFVFGIFLNRFNIQFFTYLQNNVEKEYIGRVISTTTVVALVLMPFGQILFSNLIDILGMITFAIIGFSICFSYVVYRLIVKFYL